MCSQLGCGSAPVEGNRASVQSLGSVMSPTSRCCASPDSVPLSAKGCSASLPCRRHEGKQGAVHKVLRATRRKQATWRWLMGLSPPTAWPGQPPKWEAQDCVPCSY